MVFTAGDFIASVKVDLLNWETGLKLIKNGTFRYDGSMPNSCVDALYVHKVEVCKKTLKYLRSLPKEKILSTGMGLTPEGGVYYDLINK